MPRIRVAATKMCARRLATASSGGNSPRASRRCKSCVCARMTVSGLLHVVADRG